MLFNRDVVLCPFSFIDPSARLYTSEKDLYTVFELLLLLLLLPHVVVIALVLMAIALYITYPAAIVRNLNATIYPLIVDFHSLEYLPNVRDR